MSENHISHRTDAPICPKHDVYCGQMARGPALDLGPKIDARVTDQPGRVWTPVDFLDLGPRAAVDKALQRLTAHGQLARIDRGLYYRPGSNALTRRPTAPDVRAKDRRCRRTPRPNTGDRRRPDRRQRPRTDHGRAGSGHGLDRCSPPANPGRSPAHRLPNGGTQSPYWAARPAMRVVQALTAAGFVGRRVWLGAAAPANDPRRSQPRACDPRRSASGADTLPAWMQSTVRQLLVETPSESTPMEATS